MAMYGSEATMSAAAEWAIEKGADVLTMSMGLIPDPIVSGWWCNQPYIPTVLTTPLGDLVKLAAERGIPWFAAAGNKPIVGCVVYPASVPDFITVGTVSVRWKGGDHVLEGDASPFPLDIEGKPEIVAPGGMWDGRTESGWPCIKIIPGLPCSPKAVYEVVRIATSWNSQFDQRDEKVDGWGYGAGTSISTPVAAGVAALIQQYLGGHQPGNVDKIRTLLFDNAKDIEAVGRDQLTGFGRVDADKSLPVPPIPVAPQASWTLVILGVILMVTGAIIRRRES
jgi:subtilisin family serine protease